MPKRPLKEVYDNVEEWLDELEGYVKQGHLCIPCLELMGERIRVKVLVITGLHNSDRDMTTGIANLYYSQDPRAKALLDVISHKADMQKVFMSP